MIDYKVNEPISVKQFIELLNKTTLGARRPLEDEKRVDRKSTRLNSSHKTESRMPSSA